MALSRRSFILIALLLAPLGAPRPAAATTVEGASQHIQSLGQQAFDILQRNDIPLAQREAQFARILRDGFALDLIGRFVIGRHWREATSEQQADYLDLFSRYVIGTYAVRLGGFEGDSFRITRTAPIGDRDILVTTRIERRSGPPLEAGWRVRELDGRHKIVDVVVEGVSMAATQRQEFASVIQRSGIDGLLVQLRAHVDRLPATG